MLLSQVQSSYLNTAVEHLILPGRANSLPRALRSDWMTSYPALCQVLTIESVHQRFSGSSVTAMNSLTTIHCGSGCSYWNQNACNGDEIWYRHVSTSRLTLEDDFECQVSQVIKYDVSDPSTSCLLSLPSTAHVSVQIYEEAWWVILSYRLQFNQSQSIYFALVPLRVAASYSWYLFHEVEEEAGVEEEDSMMLSPCYWLSRSFLVPIHQVCKVQMEGGFTLIMICQGSVGNEKIVLSILDPTNGARNVRSPVLAKKKLLNTFNFSYFTSGSLNLCQSSITPTTSAPSSPCLLQSSPLLAYDKLGPSIPTLPTEHDETPFPGS